MFVKEFLDDKTECQQDIFRRDNMKDITLVCGRLSEISDFNKKLHDFAQTGYEPIKVNKVEMGPLGYNMCILLIKK